MFPSCKISPGFCLLALWFGYVNGWALLGTVLGAAAFHELGHCVAILAQGGRISALRVGILGAVLETDSGRLSYPGEIAALLAGPAANLLAAWALSEGGADAAAGAHLTLAAFNLLPLWPLDGGRALELAISWLRGPEVGFRAVCRAGTVSAALLAAGIICVICCTGGSLWLLPAVFGLMAALRRSILGNIQASWELM